MSRRASAFARRDRYRVSTFMSASGQSVGPDERLATAMLYRQP